MLRGVVLDLGDSGSCPVEKPGLGEIVLDVVEATVAHLVLIIETATDAHMGRTAQLGGPLDPLGFALLRGFLLINPRSGRRRPSAQELQEAAEAAGVRTHVLQRDDDAAELARAAEEDVVGVAGGDGSLGLVAAVAIERDRAFVCIPFGTRNHFARDVRLDRDAFSALDAFTRGVERRIDVGDVDGRVFLNNVSIGLYARLVHRRERHRRRREALARLRALLLVARNREPMRVLVDDEPLEARIVLIANNAYRLDPLSIGERQRLDDGRLHLYAAHGVVRSTWEERSAERFTIDARGPNVRAAIDGEPARLETPAEFTIRPRALRLLLPPG